MNLDAAVQGRDNLFNVRIIANIGQVANKLVTLSDEFP